jgi:hypothetical protein
MAAAGSLMSAVGELRTAVAAAKGVAVAKGTAAAAAKGMTAATAKGTAPLPRRRVTVVGPLPRQPPDARPLESRVRRIEMSSSEEEDDDEGVMEMTDTDSDADAAMEEKRKHVEMVGNKSHAPMPQGYHSAAVREQCLAHDVPGLGVIATSR